MSKGNTFENDFLKLILWGTAISNIADNAASAPLTDLYMALHTDDPGEAGTQATNECAYTNYARVAVSRSASGFDIADNVGSLAAVVSFPQAGAASSETATHASIGVASSGATKLLWSGAISPNISISEGIIPQLGTGTTVTED